MMVQHRINLGAQRALGLGNLQCGEHHRDSQEQALFGEHTTCNKILVKLISHTEHYL
jgi:hypothetical protein